MSQPKTIAVVLSGCGHLDGSEVQEAVSTLLAIDRAGARYQVFAPDREQLHVVDHVAQEPREERRNALREAGRIARGAVAPLTELDMARFDALVLPGGYGAAKNLCDYAVHGTSCSVDPEVERVLREAHRAGKPIGAICIAPVLVAKVLGADHRPSLTIGSDEATARDLEALGARHVESPVTEAVVDEQNRIVSTPAYMCQARIGEVAEGIGKLVERVIALA